MSEDEFKENMSRYRNANDRMTGYFRESDSYEEWLLKCRADEDVSDYISMMMSLGLENEQSLYMFMKRHSVLGPKLNLTTWVAGNR